MGRTTVICLRQPKTHLAPPTPRSPFPASSTAPDRCYTQWITFGMKRFVDDTCHDIGNVELGRDYASTLGSCCLPLAIDIVSRGSVFERGVSGGCIRRVPERKDFSKPALHDTTAITGSVSVTNLRGLHTNRIGTRRAIWKRCPLN